MWVATGGVVSNKADEKGREQLIGAGSPWREIRKAHTKTSIWKQMENMTIEEQPRETVIVGAKRKLDDREIGMELDPDSEEKRSAKRNKLVDELVSNVLAECLDSGDSWDETYLGKLGKKDEDGVKGNPENLSKCLLKCLVG